MGFLINPQDQKLINMYSWYFNKGYWETKIKGRTVAMHRLIMAAKPGQIVDHLDGNKSNNQRENLRLTDVQGNSFNRRLNKNSSTGVQGVTETPNGYVAQFKFDGVNYYLGTYATAEEASKIVQGIKLVRDGLKFK